MKSILATGFVVFLSFFGPVFSDGSGTCQFSIGGILSGPLAEGVCQRHDKYSGVDSGIAICYNGDSTVKHFEDSLYCDENSASDINWYYAHGSCDDDSNTCNLIEVTIEIFWGDSDCSEDPTTTYTETYTTGADGACIVTEEGDDRRRSRNLLGRYKKYSKKSSDPGESIGYSVNDDGITINEYENDDCSGDPEDSVTYEGTDGCVGTYRYGYTITVMGTNGDPVVSREPTDEPTENPVGSWSKSWGKKKGKWRNGWARV